MFLPAHPERADERKRSATADHGKRRFELRRREMQEVVERANDLEFAVERQGRYCSFQKRLSSFNHFAG
jgi:hypothetical protein